MKSPKHTLAAFPAAALLMMSVIGIARMGARPQAAAQAPDAPQGWPRIVKQGGVTLSLYQPQVGTWKENRLAASAALSARNGAAAQLKYGVVHFTARTEIDKVGRLVTLDDFHIVRVEFPTDVANEGVYQNILQQWATGKVRTVDLDRLEADLAVAHDDGVPAGQALRNEPPHILFSTEPGVLITIDGEPVLEPVKGEGQLERVINTRALILRGDRAGAYYLALLGGWLSAPTLDSRWEFAPNVPASFGRLRDRLAASDEIDPLVDTEEDAVAAERLTPEAVPHIFVAYEPTELLQTAGEPQLTPIAGMHLLYVSNSDNDILMHTTEQNYYVRLSGRWFRAGSLDGPWEYVDGANLPGDFRQIPESSPMARVLTSVPGAPAAREAVIATSIPQTATVTRRDASLQVGYDGQPEFAPIAGTPLSYAVNCATPVVQVTLASYYAVYNGVWFVGGSPFGPWTAAISVPAAIYAIPPSCPIYYVTFVRIYGSTSDVVYCGYTPGYYGVFIAPDGTVVYGTGWVYPRYCRRIWIGQPWSYGCGADFGWSISVGWWFDFGIGYRYPCFRPWYGPLHHGWHPRPGWRPMWGRHGWGGYANVNVYGRWGPAAVTHTHASWNRPPMRPAPGRPTGPRLDPRTGVVNAPVRDNRPVSPRTNIPPRTGTQPRPAPNGQPRPIPTGQPRPIPDSRPRPAPNVPPRREPTIPRVPTGPSRPTPPVQPRPVPPVQPRPIPHGRPSLMPDQPVAGNDGGVYRFDSRQGWQRQAPQGWQRVPAGGPIPQLNRVQQGRILGQKRVDTFRTQVAPRRDVNMPRAPQVPAGGGGRARR